jgi:hypothetical protein
VRLNSVFIIFQKQYSKTTQRNETYFSLINFYNPFIVKYFCRRRPGFDIKVKLENYASDELVLAFHFGEKQYVKDTAKIDLNGWFHFHADTLLQPGIYLLVMKPENNYLQILIPEKDQEFTVTTDTKDWVNKIKFKGSADNDIFYDYLRFLNKQRRKRIL